MQRLPEAKVGADPGRPAAVGHRDRGRSRGRGRRRARAAARPRRSGRWTRDVLVGGPAAELVDAKDSTSERLPLALAVVGVPTVLLLFALTRSVLIPLKAIVLNLLTLGATLGVVGAAVRRPARHHHAAAAVHVHLRALDGLRGVPARPHQGGVGPARRQTTPRCSPASPRPARWSRLAALSIGIVFGGFALGELAEVSRSAWGWRVAVLLDVTVVRGLLLPAAMSLLGRWNWWPGIWTNGVAVRLETASTEAQYRSRPFRIGFGGDTDLSTIVEESRRRRCRRGCRCLRRVRRPGRGAGLPPQEPGVTLRTFQFATRRARSARSSPARRRTSTS